MEDLLPGDWVFFYKLTESDRGVISKSPALVLEVRRTGLWLEVHSKERQTYYALATKQGTEDMCWDHRRPPKTQ